MSAFRLWLSLSLSLYSVLLAGQTVGPTSGEITVQLIQGLDSATNPRGVSQGKVMKSTSPAIPVGTTAIMSLGSDPVNGGYAVKLLRLNINGQMVPAASSDVVAAPDFLNKMQEKTRAKGQPQDAASGARVFLPERMIVRFTLTTPTSEAATSERQRPERTQQPPPPKAWKIDKLPEINSSGQDVVQTAAILEGQSTIKGRTSGAYLVMHCGFPTTEYSGLLPLEVILGGTDAMLEAQGAPGMPVDVSEESSSQIGEVSPIHVNASGQNRSTGARVRFFYDAPDMNSIVNATGQPFKLLIGSGSPDIVASFALPSDNAPLKQMMSTCLQRSVADAEAKQAVTVAACSPKEGKILTYVSLQYADTGKEVKGDMDEMDNGGPARKTNLICSYRDAGKAEGAPITEKATVPVPLTARTCEFAEHANELRNAASCVSATPKAGASTESLDTSGTSPKGGAGGSQPGPRTVATSSGADLPAGPTAAVNKLNVRGISVRMGRGQILAAAKAASMVVLENIPQQLKIVDSTASGRPVGDDSGRGGSGLILLINLKDDKAVTVSISEQGAIHGEVFQDISKKWGKPSHLPSGYDSELGTADRATWGDKSNVYADYNPSIYSYGAQSVTIYDAVALTPHVPARKGVTM